MKRLFLITIMFCLALVSSAQTVDKKWGFGLAPGVYGSINDGGLGFMPEAYLSRNLSSRFDIMLKANVGLYNSLLISDVDLGNGFLNLRFNLNGEEKKFRPYLYAGPGFLADNSTNGANFDAGLGSRLFLSPSAALYFDAGYIYGIETTRNTEVVRDDLWKASIGLEFSFGKMKDADLDGVSDKKDKCPGTPAGVIVDANGCPVDTDKDGVADYMDTCPDVAGLPALKGCPDKDNDGIADKDDACPEVAGISSLKGCPDVDGDGITDAEDKCPNTPKAYKVDSSGCPIDTDRDGVVDAEDNCPTVAGVKENKGCPAIVEKKKEITATEIVMQNIKVKPVHFVSDKTYLTDYSKGVLEKLIKTLNSDPEYLVNIYGYADSQGSDEYNIKLSQARIESVLEHLVSKGIAANRIIHQKAFGKAKPIATNNTEEGRLQNRRVEFEIFKMK